MKISTSTYAMCNRLSQEEAIRAIAEAGFNAFDISLERLQKKDNTPYTMDYARELRALADGLGIECNQAHAPFPSSVGDTQKDAEIYKSIIFAMEFAAALGAKIIVVHPKHHLCYAECADELFEMNVEFYKSLIPYCKKFGIKVACENMWQSNKKTGAVTDSTCSRAWEFCKYLDAIDSEWIVGCLDIGHISLVNADISDFIHKMGNKRLQALHVHDTDYVRDLHTLPFLGKIDFNAVVKALAEIDYKGDLTFETTLYARSFPDELLADTFKMEYAVAKYLAEQVEKYR
ncbi:MAG: sugar phosphate isomerase/epimerase [Clostridia bacterium]|nr:sugar phosphate isomerase/epimerase [Clostridia bacterium]